MKNNTHYFTENIKYRKLMKKNKNINKKIKLLNYKLILNESEQKKIRLEYPDWYTKVKKNDKDTLRGSDLNCTYFIDTE